MAATATRRGPAKPQPRGKRVNLVKIQDLILAGWNPKKRVNDISGLISSIETIGMQYPILITKDKKVIDGHRRIAAYRSIGMTEIEAIISASDQAEAFAHVNSTGRPMSGNASLEIYLKEPRALTAITRGRIEACESVVGRPMLVRIHKEGLSMATWNLARTVAEAADDDRTATLIKLMQYMLKYRNAGTIKRALENDMPPSQIILAAVKGKAIKSRFVAAK